MLLCFAAWRMRHIVPFHLHSVERRWVGAGAESGCCKGLYLPGSSHTVGCCVSVAVYNSFLSVGVVVNPSLLLPSPSLAFVLVGLGSCERQHKCLQCLGGCCVRLSVKGAGQSLVAVVPLLPNSRQVQVERRAPLLDLLGRCCVMGVEVVAHALLVSLLCNCFVSDSSVGGLFPTVFPTVDKFKVLVAFSCLLARYNHLVSLFNRQVQLECLEHSHSLCVWVSREGRREGCACGCAWLIVSLMVRCYCVRYDCFVSMSVGRRSLIASQQCRCKQSAEGLIFMPSWDSIRGGCCAMDTHGRAWLACLA